MVHQITTMIFDEGHLTSRRVQSRGQQIYLYRNYYRQIRPPRSVRGRIVFMSATMENALDWRRGRTG